MQRGAEQEPSGRIRLFGGRKTVERPNAVNPTVKFDLSDSERRERNVSLATDIVNSRLGFIDKFAAEQHEPGASITLYRDQEGRQWPPGIGNLVVRGLYESLGQEVPPELDAEDPDVKHELGLRQHFDVDPFSGGITIYVETKNTPITTRIQLTPVLAIERVTTFTWENHTQEVTGKNTVHKFVRTEPHIDAVGTVMNGFSYSRYRRLAEKQQ